MFNKVLNSRKSIKSSINQQKKGFFLKEEISDFLIDLGQKRTDLQIEVSLIVEKLKFPTRTVEELEKGNVSFVQYPLNYFFSRQYACLLGAKFPDHFNMQSFKKGGY